MKKIFSVLCAGVVAMSAVAANPSDLKVYINPGHGGYDSDDRVMTIHPFADGDTATFAESKSNLGKGFRFRELLWEKVIKSKCLVLKTQLPTTLTYQQSLRFQTNRVPTCSCQFTQMQQVLLTVETFH